MRDRQYRKNLVGHLPVSATFESKPTVSAMTFARLNAKPLVRVNVPSSNLGGRNVFTRGRRYSTDTAPSYFNHEPATVYVKLKRQQVDVCDVHPPQIGIGSGEAEFAEHRHYGLF